MDAGEEAYEGMTWEAVRQGKLEHNLVPEFPSTAPVSLASLANICWNVSPSRRSVTASVGV